jgi:16S rRNA (guanine1516-N2)-methyltransferase
MVILRNLLGTCEHHAESLFQLALTCTKQRVVVKRPRLAAFLSGRPPDFSIKGKHSRFDVYLNSQSKHGNY